MPEVWEFLFVCIFVFKCFSFFFNTTLVLTSHSLSHLDTEDASETDLAKHEEEDFVEMKEQ